MKSKPDKARVRRQQLRLSEDSPSPLLEEFIDMNHPLVRLAERIDWASFEPQWDRLFSRGGGPKASPSRLAVGLLMLKHMDALSDEQLIQAWVCNPYYQYFCGETHFEHKPPVYPSTLGRWRKQLGEEGLEHLMEVVLTTAISSGALAQESLAHVCADSTVMEKNIAYPTDSRLLLGVLEKMVAFMQAHDLPIRQSYARAAPRLAQKIGRYAHAQQYKRMRALLKKLATRVGRVMRELERHLQLLDELARTTGQDLIAKAAQLLRQAKNPKSPDKLYSLHEPEVDCISKGKARKRYEFGVKVGITSTQKEGFVLGMRSYPGNPHDGHTLDDLLQQCETITGVAVKSSVVDLGYRGQHATAANVIHRGRKLSKREKKRLRRRSALEATIGHMKNDGLLDRCYLKGSEGDAIHALLCGIGHNLRLLINYLRDHVPFTLFLQFISQLSVLINARKPILSRVALVS